MRGCVGKRGRRDRQEIRRNKSVQRNQEQRYKRRKGRRMHGASNFVQEDVEQVVAGRMGSYRFDLFTEPSLAQLSQAAADSVQLDSISERLSKRVEVENERNTFFLSEECAADITMELTAKTDELVLCLKGYGESKETLERRIPKEFFKGDDVIFEAAEKEYELSRQ